MQPKSMNKTRKKGEKTMPKNKEIKKVLVIGSGPIVIRASSRI